MTMCRKPVLVDAVRKAQASNVCAGGGGGGRREVTAARPAQPKPIRVSGSNLFICSADEEAQEQRQREQNAKPRMKPGPKPGGPAAQSPSVPRGAAHAKPQMTPRTRAL